jgi:hypothetical protein
MVKCPASDRWATNCVVSGMSPGTAESTAAGFSVEEGPGAAAVEVAAGVVAAGVVPAGEDAEGDGADAGFGAALAQAPRRATSARAARSRWVMFIAAPTFVMTG